MSRSASVAVTGAPTPAPADAVSATLLDVVVLANVGGGVRADGDGHRQPGRALAIGGYDDDREGVARLGRECDQVGELARRVDGE